MASITEEEIWTATYDALALDYRCHIESQYELDFMDMEETDFVDAMLSYELIDNTQRTKQIQKEKRRKELAPKRSSNPKEGDSENQRRNKCPHARASAGGSIGQPSARVKKFCQHCKDNNGKYWTHDTVDCYLKRPHKEANALETVQKELDQMKSLIKSLKKRLGSDSDSE